MIESFKSEAEQTISAVSVMAEDLERTAGSLQDIASGTNDKAGAMQNLQRWTSARSIKETFDPPTDYRYPYMG